MKIIMKLLWKILRDENGVTLSMTRKTANTLITAAGFNTNMDEVEAVCNALTSANLAAGSVLAAAFGADVVRANYGLIKHTDGSLYVDVSDTNPALELTDGGLRAKVYGLINRTSDGLTWGRTGDVLLSSSATTPDGFTDISATYEGKMIRVSATALAGGGSDTLSGNTGSHTLTTAEMPAHTHGQQTDTLLQGGSGTVIEQGSGSQHSQGGTTQSTGGDSGHTHTLTGVSCLNAYITLKMYSKN